MQRYLVITGCLLLLAACGDDEPRGSGIVSTNGMVNNSSNATTNNATTNNATTNNATTNNAATGYSAARYLGMELGAAPADLPCRGENEVGGSTTRFDYGYDIDGRLTIVDTYDEGTFESRSVRTWQDGEIVEVVTVDATTEEISFVSEFSYDPQGRPSEVVRRPVVDPATLGAPFEYVRFNHTSPNTWGVSVLDDNELMTDGSSYAWEAASLRYSTFSDGDAAEFVIFQTEPSLEQLHRERWLEIFEIDAKVDEGFADLDDDGMADVESAYTYDGDRLTLIDITGDLTATRTFSYSCE